MLVRSVSFSIRREGPSTQGPALMGNAVQDGCEKAGIWSPTSSARQPGARVHTSSRRPRDQPQTQENSAGWVHADHKIHRVTADVAPSPGSCYRFGQVPCGYAVSLATASAAGPQLCHSTSPAAKATAEGARGSRGQSPGLGHRPVCLDRR